MASKQLGERAPGSRRMFGAPVRAWALAGWALLPLRLFLGATFTYAGLQKFANPDFLNQNSPTSIKAQLVAASRTSPIHAVLVHLIALATPIGFLIAFAELAIGVGTLLGLWPRVAAIGGATLSFTLFLTISFHASPFYTGADIVFTFAWMPLVLAGSSMRPSLEGVIAARAASTTSSATSELVAIPFAQVQRLCGHYARGRCAARNGEPCDAGRCPVLLGEPADPVQRPRDALERRTFVLRTASGALVAVGVGVAAAVAAVVGRFAGGATIPVAPPELGGTSSAPAPTSATPSALGTLLGPARVVPVGGAAAFTIPVTGDPGIVVRPSAAQFDAYDAVCPHAGCTVAYLAQNHVLACPCHGSQFLVSTGEVISGPAPHGLMKLNVAEGPDGNLYLK